MTLINENASQKLEHQVTTDQYAIWATQEEYSRHLEKEHRERRIAEIQDSLFSDCLTLKDIYRQIKKHFPRKKYPFYKLELRNGELITHFSTRFILRICEFSNDHGTSYALVYDQGGKDKNGKHNLQQIAAELVLHMEDNAKSFRSELDRRERESNVKSQLFRNNQEYRALVKQQRRKEYCDRLLIFLKGIILIAVSICLFIIGFTSF